MDSPVFSFFGSRFDRSSPTLSKPCSWVALTREGSLQTRGVDLGSSEDPFELLDRYFDRVEGGIIAGWLSYDLGILRQGLSLHRDDLTHPPLLLLAHYERGGAEVEPPDTVASPPELPRFQPTLDRQQYIDDIGQIQELIRRGYVYQINYSHRFEAELTASLQSLVERTPADSFPPYSAYARFADWELLSFSPERFLGITGRILETEPIKGTRPRGTDRQSDRDRARSLQYSPKDRAEHMMIVDLERNDLNRVCEIGSVGVPELAELYSYPTVHHLVSTVRGRRRDPVSPGDVFRNLFPGGSVTGAPKSMAVRLIHHLEGRSRGLYTGTLGYWDLDRDRGEWNLLIRTLVKHGERAWWDAGGGIVIDSDPEGEYRESVDKTGPLRRIHDSPLKPSQQR